MSAMNTSGFVESIHDTIGGGQHIIVVLDRPKGSRALFVPNGPTPKIGDRVKVEWRNGVYQLA